MILYMKKKIVMWGSRAEQKILVALELRPKADAVAVHTFPQEIATEEFYTKMMNLWRNGTEIPFPEGHVEEVRPLSLADDILPEDVKVDRTDLVNRAKTEWHFVVLSSKLYEVYKSELEDFAEKISELTSFDKGLWEGLKGFWEKVQGQVREKTLFRDHGFELRKSTNKLFDQLKAMRKTMDDEFKKTSKAHLTSFMEKLGVIEEKIEKGLGLQPIFEELKQMQRSFRDIKFTRDDRNKIWNKLDKAFKVVKEKRYGESGGGDVNPVNRLERRHAGLIEAMGKMQRSIERDEKEREFQSKKAAETDSQLEAQLKDAKIRMIDERINSKKSKLEDMKKTKTALERKVEKEKKREEKRKEQAEIEEAKKNIADKIAKDIQVAGSELSEEEAARLAKAAEDIKSEKGSKKPKKMLDKIIDQVEDIAEKAEDMVKEAVETVSDVAEEVIDKIEDKIEEVVDKVKGEEE